ncbi:CrcB family protein [Nesterenkonia ebinurensis]|uniref:CrcB family protein n=1 Tax=Nesterenkonia ebinurensis TaxID=2608252 RepID=UPI00168A84CF|nr:CrcB family protein [Nesterenkonia ebinurensis]
MSVELSVGVIAAVALGGAAGAASRFLLDKYLRAGVLIANTLGCLLLGVLIGAAAAMAAAASAGGRVTVSSGFAYGGTSAWEPWTVGLLAFGLVGALSTFATVSLRAAQLWTHRRRWAALGLWGLHCGFGITAAAGGLALGWALAV